MGPETSEEPVWPGPGEPPAVPTPPVTAPIEPEPEPRVIEAPVRYIDPYASVEEKR